VEFSFSPGLFTDAIETFGTKGTTSQPEAETGCRSLMTIAGQYFR